ncbi:MAG: hypothetical protein H0W06_06025 [Chloroflexia bacterium]|nr:hypothetical protein [Chloroflexia bacterium]
MLIQADHFNGCYRIALNNASDGAEVVSDLSYLCGATPKTLTFDFTHMAAPLTQEDREDYLPGSFGYQPTRQLTEVVAAIDAYAALVPIPAHRLTALLPDRQSRVGAFLADMQLSAVLAHIGLVVTFAGPANLELGNDDTTRQNLIRLTSIILASDGSPNFAQLQQTRSRIENVFSLALPSNVDLASSFTSITFEAVDNAIEYGGGGIIGGLYYPRAGEVEISLVNRCGGFGGRTPADELETLISAWEGSSHRGRGGGNGIAELSRLTAACFGTLLLRNGSATLQLLPDGSLTASVDETGLPTPGAAVTILLQLLPTHAIGRTDALRSFESVLEASLVMYQRGGSTP